MEPGHYLNLSFFLLSFLSFFWRLISRLSFEALILKLKLSSFTWHQSVVFFSSASYSFYSCRRHRKCKNIEENCHFISDKLPFHVVENLFIFVLSGQEIFKSIKWDLTPPAVVVLDVEDYAGFMDWTLYSNTERIQWLTSRYLLFFTLDTYNK